MLSCISVFLTYVIIKKKFASFVVNGKLSPLILNYPVL